MRKRKSRSKGPGGNNDRRGWKNPNARLTKELVLEIRRRYDAGEKVQSITLDMPCSDWAVRAAALGRSWVNLEESSLA